MYSLKDKTLLRIAIVIPLLFLPLVNFSNSAFSGSFYARSIIDLQELERFDIAISKYLTEIYLNSDALSRDSEVKRLVEIYLQDFYENTGFANFEDWISITDTKISHNFICSYRLIQRVKNLLRHVVLRTSFFRIFEGMQFIRILKFLWVNGWPSVQDLREGTDAIIKIQQAHDFDVEKLGNGLVSTVQTNCTLDSISSQAIGNAFGVRKDMSSQIQWLDIARGKAEIDGKTSVPFLQFLLRKAIKRHNVNFDPETMIELGSTSFDREIQDSPGDSKSAKTVRTILYETIKGTRSGAEENANVDYWALCSGENFQTEGEKSRLFCWYESQAHPRFQIGPVKMEFLARNPDVVQIYEILSERETQNFTKLASSFMLLSKIDELDLDLPTRNNQPDKVKFRTSLNSWILNRSMDLNASQKIEAITGLHVTGKRASEFLQVASYSFGGVFENHHDEMLRTNLLKTRIATFMFYLNDVELGGKTAFIRLGFAVTPVRGSALFWYNLYTETYPDDTLMHAACPVILGEKWVANKWIFLPDQFLIRKCTLKRKQRFQIPVNGVYLPVPSLSPHDMERSIL